ncbi:MAG: hypothetical protein Q4D26_06855 [Clostridia bacterium]|nr:hypothetical protein [Clostridia bacterium]
MTENNIAKLQAGYIIDTINKFNCSKDEKLKLIEEIILDLRISDIKQLDKAM